MQGIRGALLLCLALLFAISCAFPTGNVTVQGGNVTDVNATSNDSTSYWAGIVGTMDAYSMELSPPDPALPISYQDVGGVDVYDNSPNGTYTNISLVVTRLPDRPSASGISSPSSSDFASGGMFSNFTAFAGLDFTTFSDSPFFTFGAASLMNCTIGGATYDCPYITLLPGTRMGILKFSNATRNEPLFITVIENKPGYNGSYFDFEFMVPTNESYYFYVYPESSPPVVVIITPQPTTYSTGSIPFTYTITAYSGLDSCWYVLDGTTTSMPDCTIPYTLTVGSGSHTLTLYANETEGQVGSDSVSFSVGETPPIPPPGPTGGSGAAHIPQAPPTYGQLEEHPENIYISINISINYPLEGEAGFTLYSGDNLTDVYCYASGDFENYTSVMLESDSIRAGQAIRGTVTVSMPPTTILDYSGSTEGLLQCAGREVRNSSIIIHTSANFYLVMNRPAIAVENTAVEGLRGETLPFNMTLTNMGNGSAYAYNLAAYFEGPYGGLVGPATLPPLLHNREQGILQSTLTIPLGMEPGTYAIPVVIYENGRLVGTGTLTILVEEGISPPRCSFPDLGWTVIILLAGILAAIALFRRANGRMGRGGLGKWKPHLHALAAGALTLATWFIIMWLLGKCT